MCTTRGNRRHIASCCSRELELTLGIGAPTVYFAALEHQREVGTHGDIGHTAATAGWNVGLILAVHAPGHQGAVLEQSEQERRTNRTLLHQEWNG